MDDAALAELAKLLRDAEEGELESGLSALAQVLSECPEEDEDDLCCAVDDANVLPPLIARLGKGFANERLTYLGLSSLVNIADVGGADLVLKNGGLELLLSKLDSADTSTQYYACAGIQNVRCAPCLQRAVITARRYAPSRLTPPVARARRRPAQATADAFVVSAFVDDLGPALDEAQTRLAAIVEAAEAGGGGKEEEADEPPQDQTPVAACATGALANLRAIPIATQYTDSVEPPVAPPKAGEGGAEGEAEPSASAVLEAKLERAMRAREVYDQEQAARRSDAATVLQRAHREAHGLSAPTQGGAEGALTAEASAEAMEQLAVSAAMAAEALAAPRFAVGSVGAGDGAASSADAGASGGGGGSPELPTDAAWLEGVLTAVEGLARHLSSVAGPTEEVRARGSGPGIPRSAGPRPARPPPPSAPRPAACASARGAQAAAVESARSVELIGPLIQLLLEQLQSTDRHLVYLGLSILVNLADMGGAALVHEHGGLELLCSLLRADDLSVRYYAVAGVQNLMSSPECAARAQGTGVEEVLYAMLDDTENEQIARCAAGAIANIRRAHAQPSAAEAQPADSAGSGMLGALSALPATGLSMLFGVLAAPFRPLLRGLGLSSAPDDSGALPDQPAVAEPVETAARAPPKVAEGASESVASTSQQQHKPEATSAPAAPSAGKSQQQPPAEWKEANQ